MWVVLKGHQRAHSSVSWFSHAAISKVFALPDVAQRLRVCSGHHGSCHARRDALYLDVQPKPGKWIKAMVIARVSPLITLVIPNVFHPLFHEPTAKTQRATHQRATRRDAELTG